MCSTAVCWQLVKEVHTFRQQITHYVPLSYNAVTITNDPVLRSLSVHITDNFSDYYAYVYRKTLQKQRQCQLVDVTTI